MALLSLSPGLSRRPLLCCISCICRMDLHTEKRVKKVQMKFQSLTLKPKYSSMYTANCQSLRGNFPGFSAKHVLRIFSCFQKGFSFLFSYAIFDSYRGTAQVIFFTGEASRFPESSAGRPRLRRPSAGSTCTTAHPVCTVPTARVHARGCGIII